MPRINAVRFTNIRYDNHKRLDDIKLYFNGKSSTEINITNGGGKSVMFLMGLQAVDPLKNVGDRSIYYYFRDTREPAYVLIEWELDNTDKAEPEYFLTGFIAARNPLAPVLDPTDKEAKSITGMMNSLDFIAFAHKYTKANDYDLTNFSCIKTSVKPISIETLEKARERIREQAKQDPNFWYFNKKERTAFTEKLTEYGINAKLWAEYMSSINSSEGGFRALVTSPNNSELIMRSDEMVESFFLPAVISRLNIEYSTSPEEASIADKNKKALAGYVEELYGRDDELKKAKLYGDILDALDRALAKVRMHKDDLENSNLATYALNMLYSLIYRDKETVGQAIRNCEERIEALRAELKEIDFEELSYRYHRADAEYQETCADENGIKDKAAAAEAGLKSTESKLRIAECYHAHYIPLVQAEAARRQYEESLRNLLSEEDQKKAAALKGQLHAYYAQELARLQNASREHNDAIAAAKKARDDLQAKKTRLQQEHRSLEKTISDLKRPIILHEGEEAKLKEKGVALYRDNEGSISASAQKAGAELTAARSDMVQAKRSLEKDNERISEAQKKLRKEADALEDKAEKMQAVLTEAKQEKAVFDRDYAELKAALDLVGADIEEILPKKDLVCKGYKDSAESLRKEIETLQKRSNELSDIIAALLDRTYFLPKSVRTWLEREGISYLTGVGFLAEQGVDDCDRYVAAYPLLPYSILLTRDAYKALRKVKQAELASYAPVYLVDELRAGNDDPQIFECIFEEGNTRFLRSYDKQVIIDPEGVTQSLRYDRARVNENLKSRKVKEAGYNAAASAIEKFPYNENTRYDLEKKVRDTQEDLAVLKERKKENERQNNELSAAAARNNKEIQASQEQIKACDKRKEMLDRFLGKEPDYLKARRDYDSALVRKEAVEEEIESANNARQEKELEIAELNHAIRKIYEDISNCQFQESRYSGYDMAVVPENMDDKALLRELNTLEMKGDEKKKVLEVYIETQNDMIRDKDAAIAAAGLTKESLQALDDKGRDLDALKKAYAACREQADALRGSLAKAEKKRQEAELKKAKAEGSLSGRQPMDQSTIKGSFTERKKEAEQARRVAAARKEDLSVRKAILEEAFIKAARHADEEARVEDDALLNQEPVPEDILKETDARIATHIDCLKRSKASYREAKEAYKTVCKYAKDDRSLSNKFSFEDSVFSDSWDEEPTVSVLENFITATQKNESAVKMAKAVCEGSQPLLEKRRGEVYHAITEYTANLCKGLREMFGTTRLRVNNRNQSMLVCEEFTGANTVAYSETMLSGYLDTVVAKALDDKRNGRDDSRTFDRMIAEARLIRRYIQKDTFHLQVFKFENVPARSRLVSWDSDISGGEKNVKAFICAVAKMIYMTKDEGKAEHGITPWQVMWLDNPFGVSTAAHLLTPIYELAKLHHIQMIVMTGINDANLLYQCDKIYTLRAKTYVDGTERLHLEPQSKRDNMIYEDEWNAGRQLTLEHMMAWREVKQAEQS